MGRISTSWAVLVLCATTASAQPSPDATKLFEEGRELAGKQKWAEACDKFTKSLALDPAPGTKLNLGECLEKQGQVRKGWLMYEEAARDFDRLQDSRSKFAHDRANAAAGRLATLVIKIADPKLDGLAVHIGDRPAIPQAEIVERLDPGKVTVTATAPGKEAFKSNVNPTAGQTVVVDVPVLGEQRKDTLEEPSPSPTPAPPQEVVVEDRRHKRVVISIVLGSMGGAALISSVLVGIVAKKRYDSAFGPGKCQDGDPPVCPPENLSTVESANTLGTVGTGIAIVGGGLVVAGVIVYLTAPKEQSGVAITPTGTTSSVGLSVVGRF